MLNHEFSTREKILLFICAVLFVGIFYYFVAYQGFRDSMSRYNTSTLQDELLIEESKATRLKQMKETIEADQDKVYGTVEPYNNLANEIAEIGNILANRATNVSTTYDDPVLTDTTVRRVVRISFRSANYTNAKEIIQSIADCRYRCVISDLQINTSEQDGSTTVNCAVTFFETTNGAASLGGLVIPESSETTGVETE